MCAGVCDIVHRGVCLYVRQFVEGYVGGYMCATISMEGCVSELHVRLFMEGLWVDM